MNLLLTLLLVVAVYIGSVPLFMAAALFIILRLLMQRWVRGASAHLRIERHLDQHVFFGERTTVRLDVRSDSALPLPWLLLREHVPTGMATPSVVAHALSLPARSTATVSYELTARRRGRHLIGPLQISVGDVFGLARRELQAPAQSALIVFPRLLPLPELEMQTLALVGDVRARRRIIGDPARMHGVRDYTPGDPLHDIHWRATAATGSLQVKQCEPSTSMRTLIVLDLSWVTHVHRESIAMAELAISAAATFAARLVARRQEVGLATIGCALPDEARQQDDAPDSRRAAHAASDAPHATQLTPAALAPGRGRAHLLQLLEILALVEPDTGDRPPAQTLLHQALSLPWGSTVLIVTATVQEEFFLTAHRLREAGLLVMAICVDRQPDQESLAARARSLGVHLHFLSREAQREAAIW
jgi:uncharacterized protein (DUF58 family)